jgi:hypothetical protein
MCADGKLIFFPSLFLRKLPYFMKNIFSNHLLGPKSEWIMESSSEDQEKTFYMYSKIFTFLQGADDI